MLGPNRVAEATAIGTKSSSFTVLGKDRLLQLHAESDDQRDRWIAAVRRTVAQLIGSSGGG